MGDSVQTGEASATPERKAIDWERVEIDYRAGLLSLREMASIHGCSHVAINKRAKDKGWERDLSAKIRAKADALVTKQVVTAAVTAEREVTEREAIEIGAQALANVKMGRKARVTKAQAVIAKLWAEVDLMTDNRENLAQLGELLHAPDEKGRDRLNEIYHAVIATPERVDMAKKLVEAESKLAGMEADAWGIKSAEDDKPADEAPVPITEAARRVAFMLAKGLVNQQGGQ